MNELNENGDTYEYWEEYYTNGELFYKENGYFEWYNVDGNLIEKEFYL
jgi:hypothetical protein